jgi:GTPase
MTQHQAVSGEAAPPSAPELKDNVWRELGQEARAQVERSLGALPGDHKAWRSLIQQAVEHLRMAAGDQSRLAIVGLANVGKSTLFNRLIRPGEEKAAVSAVPGTTRRAQQADAGIFVVIDTPGADAPGEAGELERAEALETAAQADVIVVMFDAAHGIRQPERSLFDRLAELERPLIVALNKIDLVAAERAAVVDRVADALGLPGGRIVAISATKGEGVGRLLKEIAYAEPGIIGALGAALPFYRWKLSQVVIVRAASTAAAVGATPLPMIDFLPLVAIQAAMVISLARIYRVRVTLARARELLAAFGFGLVGRSLFYQLSKLGGPPGWALAAAVAGGTTLAMGYAASAWFESGARVHRGALKHISSAAGRAIIDQLRTPGDRRTGRVNWRQRLEQALEEMPPPTEGKPPDPAAGL